MKKATDFNLHKGRIFTSLSLLILTFVLLVNNAASQGESITMDIPAISSTNTPFTDTGIVVNAGETVSIIADPSKEWSTGITTSGPNGDATYSAFYDSIGVTWIHYPTALFGELIAYVGDTPMAGGVHYWAIGEYATFTPDISGHLWLGINDDNDGGGIDDNSGYMTVTINPVSVDIRNSLIALKDTSNTKDGGSDNYGSGATIHITVKDANGNLVPDAQVQIRAITQPESGGHVGPKHIAETNRNPDSQFDANGVMRPNANLEVDSKYLVSRDPASIRKVDKKTTFCNNIIAKTDKFGIVDVKYTPPYVIVGDFRLKRVVAGIDNITVSLVNRPEIKNKQQINVGYTDFKRFVTDANITIDMDGNTHDDFWCTSDTSASMHQIASGYKAWFDDRNTGNVFNPLRITAMSLPTGGLSDIDANWKEPHVTHSNGKCVDIGRSGLSQDDIDQLNKLYVATKNNAREEVNEEEDKNVLHFSFKT